VSIKLRLYNILGFAATIGSLITAIISFLIYVFRGREAYLTYSIVWFTIGLINYLLWRSKPRGAR